MNKKKRLSSILLFLSFYLSFFSFSMGVNQTYESFFSRIKLALEKGDIDSYLDLFSPHLKQRERAHILSLKKNIDFNQISIFLFPDQIEKNEHESFFLQVLFQNEYSSIIEIWQLNLRQFDGKFQISGKKIVNQLTDLYKVKIPSDRVEQVESIEIKHKDIHISFNNALVFYDNIPDFETAILVLGKGQVVFSPSIEREKHQLDLVFKKDVLEDSLDHCYLRFSNSFFRNNIKIRRNPENIKTVSEEDRKKAFSIFSFYYPRSFTFKSSIGNQRFSLIPNGQEALFEFNGKKKGKITYIFQPNAEEEIYVYQWKKNRILCSYSPPAESGKKRLRIKLGNTIDIKNYRIDLDYDPQRKYFSSKTEVQFASSGGMLYYLPLKLNPAFQVLKIEDMWNNSLLFTQDRLRKNLKVFLNVPVTSGQNQSVTIYYRGALDPQKEINDVISGGQVNDKVYFNEPSNKHDSLLYSVSSYWFPSPPEDDYYTSQLKISVPSKYMVISNGNHIHSSKSEIKPNESLKKKKTTFSFKTIFPTKYLAFIVGKFEKKSQVKNDVNITYFRGQAARAFNFDVISEAKKILSFNIKKFGSFPYEQLTIAHRLWETTGGHSPSSFIVLNEYFWLPGQKDLIAKRGPVNLSYYKEYFLAHEIAHQWWGQGVGWHSYRDQWLSEGLAQFSTILYLKEKYGETEFSRIINKFSSWIRKKSFIGQITLGSRISFYDFQAYQTIIYNKTTLVLLMLKRMLGDEVFYKGIQDFFKKYKYKSVRSSDFFKVMNKYSKKDLTAFFEKWFNHYKLPEIKYSYHVHESENGFNLEIDFEQQKEIFVFPVMVQWEENKRKITRTLLIDSKISSHHFQSGFKPKKVKVNSDKLVPGRFSKKK